MNALNLLHEEVATTNRGPWQVWLQVIPIAMQQLLVFREARRLNPDVPLKLCLTWSGITPTGPEDLSDLEGKVGRGFIPPGDMAYRALAEAYQKRCISPPSRDMDPAWLDSVTVDDAFQAQRNLEQLLERVAKIEQEGGSKKCLES